MKEKPLRILIAVFLLMLFSQKLLTRVFEIQLFETLPLPFCIFKALTGLPCPGCGMTRAFLALGRFEPQKAFLYNPFSFFLFGFLLLFLWKGSRALSFFQKKAFPLLFLLLLHWAYKIIVTFYS